MAWYNDAWNWVSGAAESTFKVVGEVGAHAISAVAAPAIKAVDWAGEQVGLDIVDDKNPPTVIRNIYRCGDNLVSGLKATGDFCVDVGAYVADRPLEATGRGLNSAVSGVGTFVVGVGDLLVNTADYTVGSAYRGIHNAIASEENQYASAWPSYGYFDFRGANATGEFLMIMDEPDPFVYEDVVGENGEIERRQVLEDVYDDQGNWSGKRAKLNEHFMAQNVFHHGPRAAVEVTGAILTGGALAARLAGTAAKLGAVTNTVITAVSNQRIANVVVGTGTRVAQVSNTLMAARGTTERVIVAGAATVGAAMEVRAEMDKAEMQNTVVQMGIDQNVEAAAEAGAGLEEALDQYDAQMDEYDRIFGSGADDTAPQIQGTGAAVPTNPGAGINTPQTSGSENAPNLEGAFDSSSPPGGSTGYIPDVNGAFGRSAPAGTDNAVAFNNRSFALVTPVTFDQDGSMNMRLKGMTKEEFERSFAGPAVV
ncbi:MAG: hypothetical protein GC137_05630 [Alphaproteobacteria bacterium]|nr:hypothetical protein [Alphaproteobacteria bacterium]